MKTVLIGSIRVGPLDPAGIDFAITLGGRDADGRHFIYTLRGQPLPDLIERITQNLINNLGAK